MLLPRKGLWWRSGSWSTWWRHVRFVAYISRFPCCTRQCWLGTGRSYRVLTHLRTYVRRRRSAKGDKKNKKALKTLPFIPANNMYTYVVKPDLGATTFYIPPQVTPVLTLRHRHWTERSMRKYATAGACKKPPTQGPQTVSLVFGDEPLLASSGGNKVKLNGLDTMATVANWEASHKGLFSDE